MKLIIIQIAFMFFSTICFAQDGCKIYEEKGYIPVDLQDALMYFDCKWSAADKDSFKLESESLATSKLHFGTGRAIRNHWGLWKRNSKLSAYFNELGINHPDGISDIILTSFHRHLNGEDIRLEEQIRFYKDYWKEVEMNDKQKKEEAFKIFSIKDTVEFLFPFDFISNDQEKHYMDDSCISKGVIIDRNSKDFLLKVKLLNACDQQGIILEQVDIYEKVDGQWILKEEDKITIMKAGELRWTRYNAWRKIE